jgi:hypothetical protein
MMLAVGLVMVPLPVDGPSRLTVSGPSPFDTPALGPSGFQPPGEVVPFAAWQVGTPVQKLAIPLRSPESGADATSNPASVVEATLPKDEPDVKNALKKVRKCVGVCCIGAAGCVSNTTIIRSEPPPPGPCPDKTVLQMEKWGMTGGESFYGQWPGADLGTRVTVREEVVRVKVLSENRRPKFREAEFEGKLFFGPDRVYGNFTKATTPEGEKIPI